MSLNLKTNLLSTHPIFDKISRNFADKVNMKLKINNSTIELKEADITEQQVDAIVNPANTQLVLGGGVAGAIRKKGGETIQEECSRLGPIEVGQAVITTAGDLNAKHVIHAVGPRLGDSDAEARLRDATLNSLKIADQNSLKSIAFPAISTGIFGFPMERCAEIMLDATAEYLRGETSIKKVVFVLFGDKAMEAFIKKLKIIEK